MALAEAIMQFQEKNAAALKERYARIVAGGGMLLLMGAKHCRDMQEVYLSKIHPLGLARALWSMWD